MTATDSVRLTPDALHWLRTEVTAVLTRPAVFRIQGPGAVECLQGVLTSDVVRPGAGSLIYGALLTPKGMIVLDLWAARLDDGFLLLVEPSAKEPALEFFRRHLPPRLARVTDLTGETALLRLIGAKSRPAVEAVGLEWPEAPGRVVRSGNLIAGWHEPTAPWAGFLAGPEEELGTVLDRLQAVGILVGGESHLEAARILAGWPGLGREIGTKTLPQEVRFDDLGGVSYTKGCYVGQETVARVHFRGHPNRLLRGITLSGTHLPASGAPIISGGREVGTLSSVLAVGETGYGLSVLRREVEPGSEVDLAGHPARVVGLPHDPA